MTQRICFNPPGGKECQDLSCVSAYAVVRSMKITDTKIFNQKKNIAIIFIGIYNM